MKTKFNQWEKRVIVFKFIFSYLFYDWNKEIFLKNIREDEILHDEYIKKILINFWDNKNKYFTLINNNLDVDWSWERISYIDKAIILSSCAEFFTHKIDKKIIIDQSLITSKKYSDENSYKFINSILDRII